MLTPEQIESVFIDHGWHWNGSADAYIPAARDIEAEVRKDDDALIRQLVESLEGYRRNHNDQQPCDAEKAARARLEKAP